MYGVRKTMYYYSAFALDSGCVRTYRAGLYFTILYKIDSFIHNIMTLMMIQTSKKKRFVGCPPILIEEGDL